MRKLGKSRREFFAEIDRPALMPLPAEPYQYAEWRRARARPGLSRRGAGALLLGAVASDPPGPRGQGHRVGERRVFHRGTRVAGHLRSSVPRRHTTVPEHMPSAHRRYAYWTPARLLEEAEKIGPATMALCEAIMRAKPHPEQGFRSCLGILALSRSYGPERIEAACRRGTAIGATSYRSIASILKNGLDKAFLPETAADPDPIRHGNIRGRDYYN